MSIAAGITIKKLELRHVLKIAFMFGLFQALMPLFGWFGGNLIRHIFESVEYYVVAGIFFIIAGLICLCISVIYGFFLSIKVVYAVLGVWGVVGGFILAPLVFGVAPWYALVLMHNSFPLIIVYGATVCGTAIMGIGAVLIKCFDLKKTP